MACKNNLWRVKVYQLGGDGDWIDNGTGLLEIEGITLTVYNEDSPDINIISYAIKEEEYKKQGETILTWTADDTRTFALSFMDKFMTQEVLAAICRIQSRDPCDIGIEEDADEINELSEPSKSNLPEILLQLSFANKVRVPKHIISTGFVQKMRKIVQDAEGSDKSTQDLLFFIFKQLCIVYLVHLNSSEIIVLLLSDDEFESVLKALENDPGLNGITFNLKQCYYESKHNNILDIEDIDLLNIVIRAHRLQFIRETALCRSLDDSACGYLFFLQQNLWKEIIVFYTVNTSIRDGLYSKLEKADDKAIEFLIELINIAKYCTVSEKHKLYECLNQDGVIILLDNLSRTGQERILELLGEVYANVLDSSPFLLKNTFFSPSCNLGSGLLHHIASTLTSSDSIGTTQELGRLIKQLLEPDNSLHYEKIADVFYREIAPTLIESLKNSELSQESLSEIISIFTFCVEHHTDRILQLLSLSDIMKNINTLMSKNKHLSIFALKFFKAVILKNEQNSNILLIRQGIISGILEVFLQNCANEGMIFSLVLNVAECFVKSSGVVLNFVVKKLVPELKKKGAVAVAEKVLQANDKLKSIQESVIRNLDPRERDAIEEERYFEESQDEEEEEDKEDAREDQGLKRKQRRDTETEKKIKGDEN